MFQHRATFIQDIREYLGFVLPYLRPLLEKYAHTGVDEESVMKWIITDEIELIYGLFTGSHLHNLPPYVIIRDELNACLPQALSVLTAQYIIAPKIYGDKPVEIRFDERDLYIIYYSDPPPFTQYRPKI